MCDLSALIDHIEHVGREKKWRTIALDKAKHLLVAHILAKVNMEHVARVLNHDIVIVTITDTQYIGRHTICSTRLAECLHGLQEVWHDRIVRLEPTVDNALFESIQCRALDLLECLCIGNHFDEAASITNLQAVECQYA